MADSFIQLPPDSTGKKLDTDELVVATQTVQRQRVLAIPPRTDQVPGRTFKTAASGSNGSDFTLYTPAGGKIFYVSQMTFSGYNSDLTLQGEVRIRDALGAGLGTLLRSYYFPATPAGTISAIITDSCTFPEPIKIATGIFCDHISGAVHYTLQVSGYEELP